jgi:Cytochrome P460
MKAIVFLLIADAALAGIVAATAPTSQPADDPADSIAAGKLPAGYRDWRLISVAHEEGNINDIRAILGNDVAIKAYREDEGKPPFPDGTIIARLAWIYDSSDGNNKVFGKAQSFVAGHSKNGIQFMVKDSQKYAATGGWKYAQFDDGKPLTNEATLENCFECHEPIKDRDYVFTRYAP